MLNVVVLVSGGGTNLQAIIDAVENGTITNTKIAGVISNNKNAYDLSGLKNMELQIAAFPQKIMPTEQHSIRNFWRRWMN